MPSELTIFLSLVAVLEFELGYYQCWQSADRAFVLRMSLSVNMRVVLLSENLGIPICCLTVGLFFMHVCGYLSFGKMTKPSTS